MKIGCIFFNTQECLLAAGILVILEQRYKIEALEVISNIEFQTTNSNFNIRTFYLNAFSNNPSPFSFNRSKYSGTDFPIILSTYNLARYCPNINP